MFLLFYVISSGYLISNGLKAVNTKFEVIKKEVTEAVVLFALG